MTDDDWTQQDERARKAAKIQFDRSMSGQQNVESFIRRARVRELEAAVNERFDTARWWLVVGDTLSELHQAEIQRQRDRLTDEATCYAIFDIEWPEGLGFDVEQAFEQNDGPYEGWNEGPDSGGPEL